MRHVLAVVFFLAAIGVSGGARAACPKENQLKMREAVMRAIEKIESYDHEEAASLVREGLKYATSDCVQTEHGLNLKQLEGITKFYLNQIQEARAAFMELFKLQEDAKLIQKAANPKLAAFFQQVLDEYRKQLQQKADTKAKIKELEDATGMPPEPAEDPAVPIEHTPREKGLRGRGLAVFCRVKDDLKAARVLLYLETGPGNFAELEMKKVGVRRYVSMLTPQQTATPMLRYYIMAFSAENKPVAASGNSANPHIVPMEIPQENEDTPKPGKEPAGNEGKSENGNAGSKGPVTQVVENEDIKKPVEDEPDVFKQVRKQQEKERSAWDAGPVPMLFFNVGGGFSAGLVSDHTEAKGASINTGFGTAYMLHAELGYMLNRTTAFTGVFQMGMVPVDKNLRPLDDEYQTSKNDFYFSETMRNDIRVLVRYKSLSVPQDLGKSMRWRHYWGLGLGGGRLRHAAPASVVENNQTREYQDTHFSSGTLFNGYGGAQLCFTDSCSAALQAEISYMASFSLEPGNSCWAHFDFILGFALLF